MTMTMGATPTPTPQESIVAGGVANPAEQGPVGLSDQNMPLAHNIAQAVALGTIQLPTTDLGWENVIKQFESTGGPVPGSQPVQSTPSSLGMGPGAPSSNPAPASAGASGGGVSSFLAAIRQHESSGNYQADSGDGAYGAYQFIPATWNSAATAAGYGKYANGRADLAPPQVQDAVAEHMAQGYYGQFGGNFNMMARAWFDPAYVNDPNYAPPGNNGLTIGKYGQDIVNLMGSGGGGGKGKPPATIGIPDPSNGSSSSAVSIAQSQLGVPYQWGGESAGHDFDCSGLVQWTFGKAGITLPRTAQEQYDATSKLPPGAQLEPGDLVFYGTSTKAIEHVGIYIGNGKMIDAPHTGATVRVDGYMAANFIGATRPGDPTGQSAQTPPAQAQQAAQPTSPTPQSTIGQAGSAESLGAYYTALNQVVSALGKYLGR